jgi:hypothetical protein
LKTKYQGKYLDVGQACSTSEKKYYINKNIKLVIAGSVGIPNLSEKQTRHLRIICCE